MEYYLVITLRLFLAAVLGGLIGMERESLNKSAGLRTHTLVALGSCLVMITSLGMFQDFGQGTSGDPSRMAAQVVSGIGFLGAGTILRSGFFVRGLTTAASVWVVAGVGLAIGAGYYFLAVAATVTIFLVLVCLPRLERFFLVKKKRFKRITLQVTDKPGALGRVSSALGALGIDIRNVEMDGGEETTAQETISICFYVIIPYHLNEVEVLEHLKAVEGVRKVTLN